MKSNEKEKIISEAANKYKEFMEALGIKFDTHSSSTPHRVAKSFVNELFAGLYDDFPRISVFDNDQNYQGMVFQGNIIINSICSHHHLPFEGVCNIAYIPSENGKIIGLSKLNRVADYFARRPQVQESLTQQICNYLDEILINNIGIAVHIKAQHKCCGLRGVKQNSAMQTTALKGRFLDEVETRNEFYQLISNN